MVVLEVEVVTAVASSRGGVSRSSGGSCRLITALARSTCCRFDSTKAFWVCVCGIIIVIYRAFDRHRPHHDDDESSRPPSVRARARRGAAQQQFDRAGRMGGGSRGGGGARGAGGGGRGGVVEVPEEGGGEDPRRRRPGAGAGAGAAAVPGAVRLVPDRPGYEVRRWCWSSWIGMRPWPPLAPSPPSPRSRIQILPLPPSPSPPPPPSPLSLSFSVCHDLLFVFSSLVSSFPAFITRFLPFSLCFSLCKT